MHDSIDQILINFNPAQRSLLNGCLGFLMFGVALDIRLADFRRVVNNPKAVVVGLLSQWFLFPLLTVGLVYWWNPPASVALGMVLVAACPSGNTSNYATHLAKGNTALSVTLTSILTLCAIVTTPVSFGFFSGLIPGAEALRQDIFVAPEEMFGTIFKLILLPLVGGMAITAYFPAFAAKAKHIVRPVSMFIFIGFILTALLVNYDNLVQHLGKIFWIVLVHNALALTAGYYVARLNRLPIAESKTLAIESGIHNTGLGLILVFNFFKGLGGMAMIAAWWGIWDLIAVFVLSWWWNRRSKAG